MDPTTPTRPHLDDPAAAAAPTRAAFAEVLFNLPIDHGFHYTIPEGMAPARGARVLASFGPRRLVGYVIGLTDTSDVERAKPILRVLDEQPVLTEPMLTLARWMADYYGCGLGEACATMVATTFRRRPLTEPTDPPPTDTPPPLTAEQQTAFDAIDGALQARRHEVFLLHGVTGSGKTELYLRAIQRALDQGRSAACLVPEIALTPQTIDRFRARFGPEVVLWHSRLTAPQRAQAWERMRQGRSRVIVGTRSAVFEPLADVGVLILDEEHETSYKQDQTPRYHAREVAIARTRAEGGIVILGSATPSIESYYRAREGAYRLLELTQRVHGRPMPSVEILDLRSEFGRGRRIPMSARLEVSLLRALEQKEQAILLLNRRGFARSVSCPGCGIVLRCPECTVPMIYHARPAQLQCHYCGRQEAAPEQCPSCKKAYLKLRGAGTERIESELHRLFPGSSIGRMDADSTKDRDAHRTIYDALRGQQLHLLVGTQMVAKGLDLPQVTLVGVISADTALNLPDFRAGERTFSLLTQVAGRAGRGDQPGRVLIQTYCPEHYAIQAAARHDFAQFYAAEIAMRRRLALPPFVHLIELTVQGKRVDTVRQAAEHLGEALRRGLRRFGVTLLGPAPHRIETLRGLVRWRIIVKVQEVPPVMAALRETLGPSRRFERLPVVVDVDPL